MAQLRQTLHAQAILVSWDLFIVGFIPFIGFVDNRKYIEYTVLLLYFLKYTLCVADDPCIPNRGVPVLSRFM